MDKDEPPVWVVSEFVVCFACDVALFAVPEAELCLKGKLTDQKLFSHYVGDERH